MAKKNSYEGVDRTMQNAAQTLLANIRFASVDDPVRSIVVTLDMSRFWAPSTLARPRHSLNHRAVLVGLTAPPASDSSNTTWLTLCLRPSVAAVALLP